MQSSNPSENESTYIIDAESAVEMTRLLKQDRLLTHGMGGLFPEDLDLAGMHHVLDIACGPGGWALDAAFLHPEMRIVGIDISQRMITYARSQAQVQGLDNVAFKVMDVRQPLDFADNTFDMVNARLLQGFMPRAAWPELMKECMRITRPGGMIRLIETDEAGTTNSPALEQLKDLFYKAMQKVGMSFAPTGRHVGITPMLGRFLRDAGCEKITQRAYVIDVSAGAEGYTSFYENQVSNVHLIAPFLLKLGISTPEQLEALSQQAIAEVLSEDFCGLWYYLAAWGRKPA